MILRGQNSPPTNNLVNGLPPSRRTVGIRFSIAAACEEWDNVRNLVDNHLDTFPETERDFVLAVRVRADAELASAEQRRSIIEAARDRFQGNARASVVLARSARIHGWEDLESSYFTSARTAFENGDEGFASRLAIAEEAMARHEPGIAADALIGQLPLDRDGAELRLLAQALVNDYPIRDRAVRFFEDLAPEVRSLTIFQKLLGALHFNRGAPRDAVEPFSAAFEQQPSIGNLMRLVRTNFAIDDKEAIVALLKHDGVDALPGSPLERIDFCHALLDFGQGARALDLAYQVLIEGLEHPRVVAKFIGLVLKPSPNRPQDFDGVVAPGVWVRLTPNLGEPYQALIGETDNRPWGEKADPENSFIAKSLGLKVDDTFEHVNATTKETQTWAIVEVKPFWLQAFHHLTGAFAQMFPDTPGFAAVHMAEGDVKPALEFARRHSEAKRKQADLYLVNGLPIAFVAGREAGASFAFAQYLPTIGEGVRVCEGTGAERSTAFAHINDNGRAGAVLDAFTAWHAAALDILPVLRDRLGPLAIPASELHRLKAMVDVHEALAGEETMSLAYEDGQYYRDIVTGEQRAEYSALTKSRIRVIEEECVVESMVIPNDLSELGDALVRSPAGGAVAPAILAGHGRLLLSEDMMMRRLASAAFGVKGVWIQAVLLDAIEARRMTLDAYTDALVYLAVHRHGHVTLGMSVLLSTFKRDIGNDLLRLQALYTYLGNKHAEPFSHIRIAAGFINQIWANRLGHDFRVNKATNLLFRALLYRHRGSEWANWAALLHQMLTHDPRVSLFQWCRGHFLPIGDLEEAVRKIRKMSRTEI